MHLKWPFGNKTSSSTARVAAMMDSESLALMAGEQGRISVFESMPCSDVDAVATLVHTFCEHHGLAGAAASVVMAAGSYQMLLVEAPPVAQDELAEALKWKVKDLLHGSIDDNVIDGFMLPDDAYRGRQKMAYSVATERVALQRLVDQLNQGGLRVDRVEIPELVLLRLLEQDSKADHAEMVIVIGDRGGFMAAIADKAIYLSRKLDISSELMAACTNDQQGEGVDQLVLELQRSRDYFESQMGKGAITRLMLAPLNDSPVGLIEVLTDRLGLNVELLAFDELIVGGAAKTTLIEMPDSADSLLLAGAAQAA